MWKSKFYGAFVLNRRVDLHAIDATPARWRGDAGSSPLDGASTAASSPRNDLVKNCRVHPTHWLISTQTGHKPSNDHNQHHTIFNNSFERVLRHSFAILLTCVETSSSALHGVFDHGLLIWILISTMLGDRVLLTARTCVGHVSSKRTPAVGPWRASSAGRPQQSYRRSLFGFDHVLDGQHRHNI